MVKQLMPDGSLVKEYDTLDEAVMAVFGDGRQIQRAMKYNQLAYDYTWEINSDYSVDYARFLNMDIRWRHIKKNSLRSRTGYTSLWMGDKQLIRKRIRDYINANCVFFERLTGDTLNGGSVKNLVELRGMLLWQIDKRVNGTLTYELLEELVDEIDLHITCNTEYANISRVPVIRKLTRKLAEDFGHVAAEYLTIYPPNVTEFVGNQVSFYGGLEEGCMHTEYMDKRKFKRIINKCIRHHTKPIRLEIPPGGYHRDKLISMCSREIKWTWDYPHLTIT